MNKTNHQFERLLKVIEELAAGNLDVRYPVSKARDEIDAIGFGVNTLAEELSETIASLEREISEHRATATELFDAERSRARADEELQRLQTARLASLGMLAAGIGHEINNPLTYVIANLDFLRSKFLADAAFSDSVQSEVNDLLDETLEGADRVRKIVRDLGIFSRVSTDDPMEETDVREVVEHAAAVVQNEIRHCAELVIESQTDPIVSTNRSRLLQVLVNLLINAAHSFGDGAVSENKIRVGITRVGLSGAKIEIEDTGVGISEEDLPRIFDPFFTTKGNADGTGLGLSICRELMSKLGGDIEVASALGRGTKFSLTLSSATDVLETEVPASQPEMGASACKLRILIVDAEFPVARSLMRMLDGSDTVVVTDGGEAIELLTADPSFDLVFCDLMMPVVSGVDVYESVKANTPELASRFVFTTGGAFTERAKRFLASVANPCLEKPFNSKELKRLIATSTVNR